MRASAAMAAMLALAGCGGEAEERTPRNSDDGELVFAVSRDGFGEIWAMSEDGTDRRRLTPAAPAETDASGNHEPAWSPDGRRIAFVSTGEATRESESDRELYVMAADGRDVRRLAVNHAPDASPVWSPDGRRIAVARTPGWGTEAARATIYVVEADGSGERRLFGDEVGTAPSWVAGLAWSPDGAQIAFGFASASSSPPTVSVYVVPSEGGDARPLLEDAAQPAWSPDGRSIAFTSIRDRYGKTCFHDCTPSGEIYVADVAGTGVRRLTRSRANDFSPAWSPGGSQVVFVSDRSDPTTHAFELWTMNARGGAARRLTDNDVWELDPDWD